MAVAPDDYMVVQDHAERGRGFFDVLGHGDVGFGRGRVARGVVVDQDHCRRAEIERTLDDLTRVDRRMVDRAALLALMLDQYVLASGSALITSPKPPKCASSDFAVGFTSPCGLAANSSISSSS